MSPRRRSADPSIVTMPMDASAPSLYGAVVTRESCTHTRALVKECDALERRAPVSTGARRRKLKIPCSIHGAGIIFVIVCIVCPFFFGFYTGTFSGRGRERRARRGAARGLGGSVGRRRGPRAVFSSSFVVAFRRVRSRRMHRRRRVSRGAPIDSSIHPSWRRSRWRSSASSVRARLGKRTRWSAVSSRLEARRRDAR